MIRTRVGAVDGMGQVLETLRLKKAAIRTQQGGSESALTMIAVDCPSLHLRPRPVYGRSGQCLGLAPANSPTVEPSTDAKIQSYTAWQAGSQFFMDLNSGQYAGYGMTNESKKGPILNEGKFTIDQYTADAARAMGR